jgi:hypothetical protein
MGRTGAASDNGPDGVPWFTAELAIGQAASMATKPIRPDLSRKSAIIAYQYLLFIRVVRSRS